MIITYFIKNHSFLFYYFMFRQVDLLTEFAIEDQLTGIVDENVIIEEVLEEWILSDADDQASDSELCPTDQEESHAIVQQESSDSGHVSTDLEETNKDKPKKRPRKRLVSPPPPPRKRQRRDDPERPRKNDFRCYVCKSESLGSAEALYAHLNSHADELPYTCSSCVMERVVIRSVTQLNVHKRMHENPVKCGYCDRRYHNARAVELHVQLHHLGENVSQPVECGHCGKVCPSLPALRTHEKLHTRALGCEFCGKLFTGRHKLREHIRRKHATEKEFSCKVCGKEFATLLAVQSHMKIKHSEQEFKCGFCERSYSSDQSRRFHEKKHAKDAGYQASNRWTKFYTLIDSGEGGAKKKQCTLCQAIVGAIGPHMTSVHFPQKYRCDVCAAEFGSKASYAIHVAEHEKGKAHRCPICEKEFSVRKLLLTHLKTKKHRDHPLSKLFFKKAPTTVEEMFGADMPEQLLENWEVAG